MSFFFNTWTEITEQTPNSCVSTSFVLCLFLLHWNKKKQQFSEKDDGDVGYVIVIFRGKKKLVLQ